MSDAYQMLHDLLVEAKNKAKKAVVIIVGPSLQVAWSSQGADTFHDQEVAHAIADVYFAVGATVNPDGSLETAPVPSPDRLVTVVKAGGYALVDRVDQRVQRR